VGSAIFLTKGRKGEEVKGRRGERKKMYYVLQAIDDVFLA